MNVCKQIEDNEDLRKAMKSLIESSVQTNIEHGFHICKEGNNIEHGEVCFGDSCSLAIFDCNGRDTIGSFHTHPNIFDKKIDILKQDFSMADLESIHKHGFDFACIGFTDDKNKPIIKCIDTKDNKLLELAIKRKSAITSLSATLLSELASAYKLDAGSVNELFDMAKKSGNKELVDRIADIVGKHIKYSFEVEDALDACQIKL